MRRLNNKIQFITESKVQNNTGSFDVVEVIELDTWAHVEQLNVSKDIEQAQQKLPKVFRVRIRDREGFYPKVDNIINWRGHRFVIISSPQVDETIRSRYLVFDIK